MSLQPVPIQNVPGVPDYTCTAFLPKSSDYCLLIPVINEGSRILTELGRAQKAGVDRLVDIVISTMISNGERLRDFVDDIKYVSHVHISEPGLEPIVPRQEHKELAMLLKAVGYSGDVSIEMKRTDVETVRKTLAYIAEVFA